MAGEKKYRSSVTGEYVTEEFAEANLDTTVAETQESWAIPPVRNPDEFVKISVEETENEKPAVDTENENG